MSVKYGLLGVLAKEPHHGYELKAAFEEKAGGFWNINYGQIYSTLDRLTRAGLVEAETEESDSGRERKVYSITEKGAADLRRWLIQPVERRRPLRDELFVKLALLDPAEPEPILRLLEDQRQFYLAQMAELTREKLKLQMEPTGDDRLMTDLLIDAALFHAEADLRWLDHCEARLQAHVARQNRTANQRTDDAAKKDNRAAMTAKHPGRWASTRDGKAPWGETTKRRPRNEGQHTNSAGGTTR